MNMEFPELGANCTLNTCKQLDFLPMKCDACSKLFCKDHIKYTEHSCENAYKKDFQVPVCPLCNKAVPVPRGEQPDIKVGEHIDRDCQSDPAVAKRKAYQNRCSLKGCKQKELIPVRCESCRQNFCLKHRHEQDHNCSGVIRGASRSKTSASLKAGEAAATRAKNVASSSKVHKKPQQTSLSSIGRDLDRSRRERQMTAPNPQPIPQPALSEDEALALAIQASLQDQSKTKSPSPPPTTQEEEDRALARALAESEREEQKRRRQQEQQKKSDCCVT